MKKSIVTIRYGGSILVMRRRKYGPRSHRLRRRSPVPDERQREHEAAHHEEDQHADRSVLEDGEESVRACVGLTGRNGASEAGCARYRGGARWRHGP